nr:hypothetical protein [Bifidobacterium sp. UBA6881]
MSAEPKVCSVNADTPDSQSDGNSAARAASTTVPAYSATRRTARKHKRVVRQGTELFDADGVKLEPSDVLTERQREADDDKRILGELPPHWGVFSERGR